MINQAFICSSVSYGQLYPHLLQIYQYTQKEKAKEIKGFMIVPILAENIEEAKSSNANKSS